MKTLILDGSHANDSQVAGIKNALCRHLPDAETIILREQKIGNCAAVMEHVQISGGRETARK